MPDPNHDDLADLFTDDAKAREAANIAIEKMLTLIATNPGLGGYYSAHVDGHDAAEIETWVDDAAAAAGSAGSDQMYAAAMHALRASLAAKKPVTVTLDPSRGDAADARAEIAHLRAERDAAHAEIADLESRLEKARDNNRVLKTQVTLASSEIARTASETEDRAAYLRDVHAQMSELQNRVVILGTAMDHANELIGYLRAERTRLDDVEAELKTLSAAVARIDPEAK